MALDVGLMLRSLSPRLIAKGLMVMDKSTAIVVSVCWLAAMITLIVAAFAVHGATNAKRDAEQAIALEPVLPQASTAPLSPHELQTALDRMQHQFPDIKFDPGSNQSIEVHSEDGSKFHQWITALSYLDTMSPDNHWSIRDFCVGVCPNGVMRAQVVGEKMVFSLPQH